MIFYTVLENLCTLYHCAVIATKACLYSCYYICNKCLCTYMYTCIYFRFKKRENHNYFPCIYIILNSCYNQPKRCAFTAWKQNYKIKSEFINLEINSFFVFCSESFRITWLEIKYWYFHSYWIIKKLNKHLEMNVDLGNVIV